MYMMESPLMDFSDYKPFENFFNWTMTYRLDSEIVTRYAWIDSKDSTSLRRSNQNSTDLSYHRGNGEN